MRKKHASILIILTLLASVATSLTLTYAAPPVSEVTFRVEPHVTSGVAVGQNVTVDVYIDAPGGSAIIGWAIDMKVDPDVLEPGAWSPIPPPFGSWMVARSGVSGYFLYGWCVHNKYPNYTKFFEGDRYPAVGVINGTIETIVAWAGLEPGTGADGTGKLATFYFTSQSETAYSPIEITKAFYYTSLNSPDPDKKEPDIIINGYYNEPPIINMIGHSAWPEHHNHPTSKHGWDITLFARIRNDGPTTTYGKVVFETVDSAGVPVMSPPETDPIELVPGDPAVKVNVTWTIPGYDRYYMTARVYVDLDGNLATSDWTRGTDKPKSFTFNVKP